MKKAASKPEPVVFSPNLEASDAAANYWMRQAMLRLRREIAWIWNERGAAAHSVGELPPFIDRVSDSLDLARHHSERAEFFKTDVAAKYLTSCIDAPRQKTGEAKRGGFGWVAKELGLGDAEQFVLALALTSAFDAATGAVIAACLNDSTRTAPNLALAQRLWDEPADVLMLADPAHPLFSHGLLTRASASNRYPNESIWDRPLTVSPLVSRALLGLDVTTHALRDVPRGESDAEIEKAARFVGYRLIGDGAEHLRVVPLLGNRRAAFRPTAVEIARIAGLRLWEFEGDSGLLTDPDYLNMLAALSWLKGRAIFVRPEMFNDIGRRRDRNEGLPSTALPVTMLVGVTDRGQVSHIEPELLSPFVAIPALSYEARLAEWKDRLGSKKRGLDHDLREVARRFRFEKETIAEIAAELRALPDGFDGDDLIAACRAELTHDVGELAIYVEPRFEDENLYLPAKQSVQFDEQIAAMESLAKVHYDWGTARAWNEGGIIVMFAGPPGTGKTMAAEIMAQKLKLPMYRVDLSQIVNKYIGETEKNLKRIFDAAEISDMVLFFDEADALFRKRTEVSDSRDSYANLTVSYLLERMERFKGLAILATNRQEDLDRAFVRRIRHIIDFPLPDEAQRVSIWNQVIPPAVAETSKIDVPFLARRFPLSGGHIRSIVFNACLQSAHRGNGKPELFMRDVLIAVKREYDKMNRSLTREQLGPYAAEIDGIE